MRTTFLFLTCLFFCFKQTNAQYIPQYRNLVLEGGGIKGIAYGGALAELEDRGVLKDIIRVAGTSAGAIQACLIAVGYSAEEITELTANTPIESFNDDGFVPRGTKRLLNQYGWYKGESFLSTLEGFIYDRTGNIDLTFAELHKLAESYPFRDLYVVGADLSAQKSVVFSHETHPNMRIADAVRVSMSIPLYYKALWLNEEGKVIEEPTPDDPCHLFVDGGILMNYPVEIFDKSIYIPACDDEYCDMFNPETIGMRLDRPEQINQELENGYGIAPYEIEDFGSYMSALASILMRNVSPAHPKDVDRTIYINDLGISPKPRKVPEDEKLALMAEGRKGVELFLTRINLLAD
ncbi:patatin-like phospholipase family protein [Jiulongibacter sp. NS-SX5]|uniref:patatin-like phospholipase family protein n=1 Tax=Jiulongibacter sp. NS-SX5 TaxID=3463854 RepID=UPI0040597FBF